MVKQYSMVQVPTTFFDVTATKHHIFEGLTFRNTDIAFVAGQKEVAGASDLTIRNCRFEEIGIGITTEYAGSKKFLHRR